MSIAASLRVRRKAYILYLPGVRKSLDAFLTSQDIKNRTAAIYFLEGTRQHGWTKPYYMWVDCESPENFNNVTAKGIWSERVLWTEPEKPFAGNAATNAWCCLRLLT